MILNFINHLFYKQKIQKKIKTLSVKILNKFNRRCNAIFESNDLLFISVFFQILFKFSLIED